MNAVRQTLATTALTVAAGASAQVQNLRIAEVDPANDQVEIINLGPGFNPLIAYPFCHRFDYNSTLPLGTIGNPGALAVTVANLDDNDSDIWLYATNSFGNPADIVHGVKYGSLPNVGRTSVAVTAGIWPNVFVGAPTPDAGETIAWDWFGNDPRDWYIDATPSIGAVDPVAVGTVPTALIASGTEEDFQSLQLGDQVDTLAGWLFNRAGQRGMFSARIVPRVMANLDTTTPGFGSNDGRWLRIRDQDPGFGDVVRTSTITATILTSESWRFRINHEEIPPVGSGQVLAVQYTAPTFTDMWGLDMTNSGVSLAVSNAAGTAALAPLYSFSGATAPGQWIDVDITANYPGAFVSASVNGGTPVTLPITFVPPVCGSASTTLTYGGGLGTFLLDDVGYAVCPCEFDGTPGIGINDLLAYVALFFAGSPLADLDCDGATVVIDLLAFLTCFFENVGLPTCP